MLAALGSVLWVVLSGILFGSQFVPAKYCPSFDKAAYHVSMAVGIMAGSILFFAISGKGAVSAETALFGMIAGAVWVGGNYCLILAVSRTGMARAFTIINLTAVFSFIGGGAFLGELGGRSSFQMALMSAGLVAVVAGSVIVGISMRNGKAPGGGSVMGKGVFYAFLSTIFFAAYNVLAAVLLNKWNLTPGTSFLAISPGIFLGAILIAAMAPNASLGRWRVAPGKWHALAAVQGLIWAAAMVAILIGWMGTGIALGTPVQLGTQTIVSALWGIAFFGEFGQFKDKSRAHLRFGTGAALAILGIAVMTLS